MESINEKLVKLYSDKWDILLKKLDQNDDENPIKSAYPLLISINEEKYYNKTFAKKDIPDLKDETQLQLMIGIKKEDITQIKKGQGNLKLYQHVLSKSNET